MDLGKEAAHAVDEVMAAHPGASIELEESGDLEGSWDCARLGQVMTNLLNNAVQHGSTKTPIKVTVEGRDEDVVLRVHNRGPAIPEADLPEIFSPFKRLHSGEPAGASSNLGLGVYIVERVVTAHGGTIEVTSTDDDGTAFIVRLPR